MTPRAELHSVSVTYGPTTVLSDITLSIQAGECIALVGPNGSGKSTLLRTLAGFLTPSTGVVLIDGRECRGISNRELARLVAYCRADELSEWPLSVEQCVSLGRSPHRGWVMPLTTADRAVVNDMIERCGLTPLRSRSVHQLSDGERQRVALARSLSQQPKLLLLDEPTANLDLKYQVELLQLVRGWTECGLTVIAAIHDLTLAAGWADRVVMLKNGRCTATGSPVEVFTPDRIQNTYDVSVGVHRFDGRLAIVPRGKS